MPAITGFTSAEVLTAANTNAYLLYPKQNYLLNGDFSINQRTASSTTTNASFVHDRWRLGASGGTATYSTQNFALGTISGTDSDPVSYARLVTSGQSAAGDYASLYQKIEDVRTLSGQTVTVSFWARTSSGTPKVAVELIQHFGAGGSPSADVTYYLGQATTSTTWTRFQFTTTLSSVAGKTLGTTTPLSNALTCQLWTSAGSTYNSRTGTLGIQNTTIEIWGVKLEQGAVRTPFIIRPFGEELALCQRYFQKSYPYATAPGGNIEATFQGGVFSPSTDTGASQYVGMNVALMAHMRANPNVSWYCLAGNSNRVSTFTAGGLTRVNNVASKIYGAYASANAISFICIPAASEFLGFAWVAEVDL